ncbi:MAG TPA: hypothetical protein VH369_26655 [Bryobacteraceae bacterium]
MTLTDPLGATGRAYARGSATAFLPTPGSPLMAVGGQVEGSIGVYPSGGAGSLHGGGNAEFAVSLDQGLSTSGPARSGFIRASYFGSFGSGPDGPDAKTFDISIGSFTPSIIIGLGTYPLTPFTLGQNFLFHEDLSMRASAQPIFGILESAEPRFQWTFTLFEADGVTPVQVSLVSTPEPRSWALLAVAFFIFALARRPARHLLALVIK